MKNKIIFLLLVVVVIGCAGPQIKPKVPVSKEGKIEKPQQQIQTEVNKINDSDIDVEDEKEEDLISEESVEEVEGTEQLQQGTSIQPSINQITESDLDVETEPSEEDIISEEEAGENNF